MSFGAVHANLGQRLPPRRTAPRTRWGGNGWATVMTLKPLRPAHSIASAEVAAAQNGGWGRWIGRGGQMPPEPPIIAPDG